MGTFDGGCPLFFYVSVRNACGIRGVLPLRESLYDICEVSGVARWIYYNPNTVREAAGDCVIRAVCAVTGQDWDLTYTAVTMQGLVLGDMPSANHVWRAYLRSLGYRQRLIPDTCPDCYTVNDFAEDHPRGKYILGTGKHAVAVIDGEVWDTWDSRSEIPLYYYEEV